LRCSLFYSLLRPPLPSTLFPYTTLFRSGGIVLGSTADVLTTYVPAPQGGLVIGGIVAIVTAYTTAPQGGIVMGSVAGALTTYATDRKSTRLNSSHLVISYAVFCLKKKKT